MCCCGKPTINGELGYKWQPNDAPMTRQPNPPDMKDGEILIHDEPGRCGGIDSHCHHYRVTRWGSSSYFLRVRHGGGDDVVSLRLYGNGLKDMLAALDSNTRYWLLNEIWGVHSDAIAQAKEAESYRWKQAAAEKRIKTRRYPKRGICKVWIESALQKAG